jgi:hypothetical protein
MRTRALVVWFGLLVVAFANGALREMVVVPAVGDTAGHAISSITLSAAILLVAWFTIVWIHPASAADAWTIGALWLTLTLAFEFLVGHYVFGNPWSRLLADYNVAAGRIWVLVLMTTVVAPAISARAHGLIAPATALSDSSSSTTTSWST